MPLIMRDDAVPKRRGTLWVESPKVGVPMTVTIYSLFFQGVWTHYTSKGSKPCFHERCHCEGGHDKTPLRWLGYLHCHWHEGNKQAFIQVPAMSARAMVDQFAPGASLRGHCFDVTRKAKCGTVKFLDRPYSKRNPDELPAVVDCLPSLFRVWKVDPRLFAFRVESELISTPEMVPVDPAA